MDIKYVRRIIVERKVETLWVPVITNGHLNYSGTIVVNIFFYISI